LSAHTTFTQAVSSHGSKDKPSVPHVDANYSQLIKKCNKTTVITDNIKNHFFFATFHPSSISCWDNSIAAGFETSATITTGSGIFSSLVFLAFGFLVG